MAIRRRTNEALLLSAVVLLFLNYRFYDKHNEPESVDVKNQIDYDYVNPPPCRKTIEEAIRLNELIANVWYKCKRIKRIPDEPLGYHICVDDLVGIPHVFSGDRLVFVALSGETIDYRLEKTLLKIANGHRLLAGQIISSRSNLPAGLEQYSSNLHFSSIKNNELKHVPLLAAEIANRIEIFARNQGQGLIDILKLACIDCWRADHLALLLNELIKLNILNLVRQLHLIVRIDQADSKLLYLWYKTIHRLFYMEGTYFALYAAQQLGDCGRTISNCQYQLAFAKIDPTSSLNPNVMAPVAGMGMPDEEHSRLVWYLNQNLKTQYCSEDLSWFNFVSPSDQQWRYCNKYMKSINETSHCLIYYFGIGDSLLMIGNRQQFPARCTIHLFDPTMPYEQYVADGVNSYGVTLANEDSGNRQPGFGENDLWRLSTFNAILEQTNPEKLVISLLIMDLQGGEWDIFEQILSAASLSIFSQFVIRIRIWQGEENENYRQYYSWFYRLQRTGYKLINSRSLTFTNALNGKMECKPNRCYELVWVL